LRRVCNYIALSILIVLSGCNPSPSDLAQHEPSLERVFFLPEELRESSGLIIYDSLAWSFNDSGSDPVLFGIDLSDSAIRKKIYLQNARNADWEDIGQDQKTIYIGDFGNSSGSRQFLTIYLLSKDSITCQKEQYVFVDSITFTYAEQENFESVYHSTEYDCESLFSMHDSLFILTKDWVNYETSLYAFPKIPGKYELHRIGTFDSEGLVTGASYNSTEDQLAICGYAEFIPFVILMGITTVSDFFNPHIVRYDLDDYPGLQIEGIEYAGNQIFLSSENSSEIQALYHFSTN
jgi:hypothetical protein